MLGYRKRSFAQAHALLQALRINLKDLATLKDLQKLLLREIVRAEAKIRELKTELRDINARSESASGKKRSAYLENRIEGFRRCAYIWRSFGDAIAFLYMDKFALKHCFYNVDNIFEKHDAGFILGKEGLANELLLLDSALEHNVPALLVDLTNTIRHGDICLMGESDPYLIEVKASKKLNSRSKKQKRDLEKLHTFYETDKAEGLRGFPEVRRQVYEMPELTYVDEINECIAEAVKNGFGVSQPERGLHYLVMTNNGPDLNQALGSLAIKAPWVFFLNRHKSERELAPYMPFTLTIERKDHLWEFIRGNLFIFVLVDLDILGDIAVDKGYKARLDLEDEEYPLRLEVLPGEGMAGISAHMLQRIAMEFVSPEWLVLCSIEGLKRHFDGSAPVWKPARN